MILAKCCHDMDILNWLVGTECLALSSFGSLGHFKPEHSPKGAPERCIQGCPEVDACPYSALRYLDKQDPNPMVRSFANTVVALADGASLEEALRTGPYGRCVYRCDNDVVDHQTASLHYSGGVDVAFTMAAFTDRCDRTLKFMGSRGEIRAAMDDMDIELRQFRKEPKKIEPSQDADSGHGGGDEGLIRNFIDLIRNPDRETMRRTNREGLAGHRMALAAEVSRLSNGAVQKLDNRS
jgi:predicted dehydrogenase